MKFESGLESESSVIGQFIHQLDGNGKADTQGQVLSITNGVVSIQLSDFANDNPTAVVTMPVLDFKDKSKLARYKTQEKMKEEHVKIAKP